MRHLDDGTLQSWLDGPRSGMGGAERDEIERHLASCGTCAARASELDDAASGVRTLLAAQGHGAHEAPDFKTVVARARAKEIEGRRWSAWRTAAWAAGVAAVLGVGWLSHDLYRSVEMARSEAEPSTETTPTEPGVPAPLPPAEEGTTVAEGGAPTETGAPAPLPPAAEATAIAEADVPGEGTEDQPAMTVATGPRVVRGRVTDESGRPLGGAQVFVPGTGRGGLTNQNGDYRIQLGEAPPDSEGLDVTVTAQMIGYGEASQAFVSRVGDTATADFQLPQQAIALDELVVTGTAAPSPRRELGNAMESVPVRVVLPGDSTWGGSWDAVGRAEAEARAGFRLYSVPDLPVIIVEVNEKEGNPVVRISQEIEEGLVLHLILARELMSISEDALPLADVQSFDSTQKGDIWIAATAPIPADSLRAMIERLR